MHVTDPGPSWTQAAHRDPERQAHSEQNAKGNPCSVRQARGASVLAWTCWPVALSNSIAPHAHPILLPLVPQRKYMASALGGLCGLPGDESVESATGWGAAAVHSADQGKAVMRVVFGGLA
jgi:hypothetical protein